MVPPEKVREIFPEVSLIARHVSCRLSLIATVSLAM